MPAGPVMRPGAEAWHGGPSTWAVGCVGGGCGVGAGIAAHQAAHSTWRQEEDPDPVMQWP